MKNLLKLGQLKKIRKKKRKAKKKDLAVENTLEIRRQAINNQSDDIAYIYKSCMDHIVEVKQPLVLISQIQRSGGSLLSQLFDGHSQLHSHPSELMIGYPRKNVWPQLDLAKGPDDWFEILFEDKVIEHFRNGYTKGKRAINSHSFIFLAALQKQIFLKCLSSKTTVSINDIFHAYMTSYFGAWINNQNFSGDKRFVTAFTPRLANDEHNVKSFFQIYPEGRIISIVRDPKNWYPSAIRHSSKSSKYAGIENALNQWNESTQSMIRNKEKWGDRISIIKFEDLVTDTETVMRKLADYLGIQFDPILLVPTFNKYPIQANTSFETEKTGIIKKVVHRYDMLSDDDLRIITSMTDKDYNKVLTLVSIK